MKRLKVLGFFSISPKRSYENRTAEQNVKAWFQDCLHLWELEKLSIGRLKPLGRDCESERFYGNKSEVIGSLPQARMDTSEQGESREGMSVVSCFPGPTLDPPPPSSLSSGQPPVPPSTLKARLCCVPPNRTVPLWAKTTRAHLLSLLEDHKLLETRSGIGPSTSHVFICLILSTVCAAGTITRVTLMRKGKPGKSTCDHLGS